MQLRLYEAFSKRKNSTKWPEGGYEVEVVLKQDTSIINPVFLIDGVNLNVTYCLWDNKFYFVDNIVLQNRNIYELRCSLDVLATYRGLIQNTSAYIEYSSQGDTTIPDSRIPVVTNPSFAINQTESIFTLNGKYYVSITGAGSTGLYKVDNKTQLNRLVFDISDLYPDVPSSYEEVGEAITTFAKQLIGAGSIGNNIRSCFWLPYDAPAGSYESLKVGIYPSTCLGAPVTAMLNGTQYSVSIPWQFSDWRNTSPYTEVYLYLPFVGTVSFPSSNLKGVSTLTIHRSINVASGSIAYQVNAGNEVIGCYSADIAVPIPIGSSNINPTSAIGGLISGVSSAVAGNISGVAMSALSALKTLNTNAGGLGGGASAGLDLHIKCFTICHGTTVAPSSFASIKGYPFGRVDSLNNHSGYVQTIGFSVDGHLLGDEADLINAMLDSGIYIED